MIKRYGFSIIFSCITAAVIIGFYSYINVTANESKEMKIETKSGDEKIIQDVAIIGTQHINNQRYGMKTTSAGTELIAHSVLFKSTPEKVSLDLLKFQKKYKKFMRGKYDLRQLYEDKEFLIYADRNYENKSKSSQYYIDETTENIQLDLFVYDKQNKKNIEFTVDASSVIKGDKAYHSIEDVQLRDQDIIVILNSAGQKNTVLNRIIINIEQKKIKEISTIQKEIGNNYEGNSDHNSSFHSLYHYSTDSQINPSDYYAYKYAYTNGEKGMSTTYLVNIITGEKIEIPQSENMDTRMNFDNSTLYNIDEPSKELSYFDTTTAQWQSILKYDEPTKESIIDINMKDRNLYILSSETESGGYYLTVYSLDTKENVYNGQIKTSLLETQAEYIIFQ